MLKHENVTQVKHVPGKIVNCETKNQELHKDINVTNLVKWQKFFSFLSLYSLNCDCSFIIMLHYQTNHANYCLFISV